MIRCLLCIALLTGCSSLLGEAAKSMVGVDNKPAIEADANLDVGAAVQLGQENHNTKVSNKETDKRLVSNEVVTTTEAEQINETVTQSWSVPWWALLIAVLSGIMVDPMGMYERWRHIRK